MTVAHGVKANQGKGLQLEEIEWGGWSKCLRLFNDEIELIITVEVGPRIISCRFLDGENIFKTFDDQLGTTGGSDWKPYGGHRLWHAPEDAVRTYSPDNNSVDFRWDGHSLKLMQSVEPGVGIAKELEISLDPEGPHVEVIHRLVNKNQWDVELSPWALTQLAPGGRLILPQEPYGSHPEYLAPARPLVLWSFTNMADPRLLFGEKYISISQDPEATTKNKIGILNTTGWGAYELNGDLFIKIYSAEPGRNYPDMGCNTESYVGPDMLEFETLGPLVTLDPGGFAQHTEHWVMVRQSVPDDEAGMDETLTPLIAKLPAML